MFIQLQAQSGGVIDNDAEMTLAMTPSQATFLKEITQYNTNSVEVLLKENFPNLKIVTAVQYLTAAGQLMQLICNKIEGTDTVNVAFSSKLMAHSMVRDTSSVKQKRSSGSYGAIWRRPFASVTMVG